MTVGELTLPVTKNDDETITCISCNEAKCEWTVLVLGNGRQVAYGAHERCIRRQYKPIAERQDRLDPRLPYAERGPEWYAKNDPEDEHG